MRALLLVSAVVVALGACEGEAAPSSGSESPDPSPSSAPSAPVPSLEYDVVATMSLESGDLSRVALCGGHYAYVAGQSQVMLADWRALATRAVFTTDHSFLYAVRRSTCHFKVFDTVNGYNGEDPSEPGRTLDLDLRTGLYSVTPGSSDEVELPSRIVRGSTFTARLRSGHVWGTPLSGGPEGRMPGKVGRTGGLPVAHGTLLAYPVWHHGRTRLRVLRIET
jgi:hypothetical protein